MRIMPLLPSAINSSRKTNYILKKFFTLFPFLAKDDHHGNSKRKASNAKPEK